MDIVIDDIYSTDFLAFVRFVPNSSVIFEAKVSYYYNTGEEEPIRELTINVCLQDISSTYDNLAKFFDARVDEDMTIDQYINLNKDRILSSIDPEYLSRVSKDPNNIFHLNI